MSSVCPLSCQSREVTERTTNTGEKTSAVGHISPKKNSLSFPKFPQKSLSPPLSEEYTAMQSQCNDVNYVVMLVLPPWSLSVCPRNRIIRGLFSGLQGDNYPDNQQRTF